MENENEIEDGTCAALWINEIVIGLKEAAYHVEGLAFDAATAATIEEYLEKIEDLTTDLSAVADDVFDAANA